jgi:pimeloyl-ACP methyl ester carboxylesterase
MTEHRDVWYQSNDGLRLYARDYPHPAPRATVLCMHGLTRNSTDFGELCAALNDDFRLIAVDQRGRGRSQYDPNPVRYHPGTYVQDMFTLLAHLGLQQVIAIGTSMGGLMAMMMAALRPGCLRAAVLNDVGPEVDPRGLARIKSYVGKTKAPASWAEAADLCRQINGVAFPDYTDADWMAFARRTFREDANGKPYPAYDPAIAQPINTTQEAAVPPDLWPAFAALHSVPTLVVRGVLSDILSPDCVSAMRARKPDLQVVEVPNRGHAPMLDETAALKAIRSFLAVI